MQTTRNAFIHSNSIPLINCFAEGLSRLAEILNKNTHDTKEGEKKYRKKARNRDMGMLPPNTDARRQSCTVYIPDCSREGTTHKVHNLCH